MIGQALQHKPYVLICWAASESVSAPSVTNRLSTGVSLCDRCRAGVIGTDGRFSVQLAGLSDRFHTRATMPLDGSSSAGFKAEAPLYDVAEILRDLIANIDKGLNTKKPFAD